MACWEKERTGSCDHFQCPYPSETEHGFECIELIECYCEIGLDCLEKCPYSYTKEDEAKVDAAIKRKYPEDIGSYSDYFNRTRR